MSAINTPPQAARLMELANLASVQQYIPPAQSGLKGVPLASASPGKTSPLSTNVGEHDLQTVPMHVINASKKRGYSLVQDTIDENVQVKKPRTIAPPMSRVAVAGKHSSHRIPPNQVGHQQYYSSNSVPAFGYNSQGDISAGVEAQILSAQPNHDSEHIIPSEMEPAQHDQLNEDFTDSGPHTGHEHSQAAIEGGVIRADIASELMVKKMLLGFLPNEEEQQLTDYLAFHGAQDVGDGFALSGL